MTKLLLPALLLTCCSGAAQASAWTLPAGEGQVIASAIYSHSDKGFDADGDTVDIADYTKAETYVLIEYGVTDDLTVIAIPSFSHVEVENGTDTTGLGFTELGARYRLAQGGAGVLSVQATVRIPGEERNENVAQTGSTGAEIDLRALAGTSFKLGELDGFLDVQGGYRIRYGGPPNEYRLDATLGVRPAANLLLLAQTFNVVSDGTGTGVYGKHRYSNVYLSGAYDIDPKWTVQLGVIGTVGGKNALRERGLLASVWRKF